MFQKAFCYYFVLSGQVLSYFKILSSKLSEFFDDVLSPPNGNRLIVLNSEVIKTYISEEDFEKWQLMLCNLSLYNKIIFLEIKTTEEQNEKIFKDEDNECLKKIKTCIRRKECTTRPIAYLYTGKTNIDSETNELLLLNAEEIEKKQPFLGNKKPRFFFTETRQIPKDVTTQNFFLQANNAEGKNIFYHDPHLLHKRQFEVFTKLVYQKIALRCREFKCYTLDIDLINKYEDINISNRVFQHRALLRAQAKVKTTFKEYCKGKSSQKVFIVLCQNNTEPEKGFIPKTYSTQAKKWFRDKRFEVSGCLSFICSQTFLHLDHEEGEDCVLNVIPPLDNHDLKFSTNFKIYTICLHGLLREQCCSCR